MTSRKRRPLEGRLLPDTDRKCAHCGGKLYRWLVFNEQTLVSTQPWKHWGTGSEYCDNTRGEPA